MYETTSIHIDAAFICGPTSATTSARGPRRLSRRDSEQLAVGVFRVGRDQLNRGAPHPAHGQQLCPAKRCVATSASAVATIARSMGSRRRETPAVNLNPSTCINPGFHGVVEAHQRIAIRTSALPLRVPDPSYSEPQCAWPSATARAHTIPANMAHPGISVGMADLAPRACMHAVATSP